MYTSAHVDTEWGSSAGEYDRWLLPHGRTARYNSLRLSIAHAYGRSTANLGDLIWVKIYIYKFL